MANNDGYDLITALTSVEEYLIESMIRNMKRHRITEDEEGLSYAQWQAVQLKALNEYRRHNEELLGPYFSTINDQIAKALRKANELGQMSQETKILKAIQQGYKVADTGAQVGQLSQRFFSINEERMQAFVKAKTDDMKRAEYAMLRMSNDQYRKIIYNTGAAYSTGALTYEQAVDMATKDFLRSGINCIEYSNGRRVNVDTYARMAIQTNATRSYLAGEAIKRDDWGVNTVIVNKRGMACPLCTPWLGRVLYDDVYSTVPVTGTKYPKLSSAVAAGFLHPNCKDSFTSYFEGINSKPSPPSKEEQRQAEERYAQEQEQRHNERMAKKYQRMADNSLDPENKVRHQAKADAWKARDKVFKQKHGDVLKERRKAEMVPGLEEPRLQKVPKILREPVVDEKLYPKDAETYEKLSKLKLSSLGEEFEIGPEPVIGSTDLDEYMFPSLGAKSRNYMVRMPDGSEHPLVENTYLRRMQNHTIAGKGVRRKIDDIDRLVREYDASAEDWTKEKGYGYIDFENDGIHKVEIHWYEHPDCGKVELKTVYQKNGGLYVD